MQIKKLVLYILLLSIVYITPSYAQFGKNKVQYKNFQWQYIQSKHFDIYFSQGGYDLAEYTAAVAESSLVSLSKNLDYNIKNRIPLIVFNSHNEFQQNNIIDEFLPEGVGGVTELFKNRVLIPFEGNYEQFRHVIHHELLHAFMNDMYYGGSIQNIISKSITLNFPIWFNEGMAECQSLDGLDKATDEFMRDIVISNNLPPLEYIQGYLSYRAGQSFFSFLMDTYGKYKLGELMNNIKSLNDVDAGFKETFKLDMEKLNEKWQKELKKMYWPEIKTKEDLKDFSKSLTDHIKEGGYYNVSPVISPKGDKFVFISNRDDLFDVYLANAKTGEIIDKLVSGNTNTNFEELQVLTPGLTWSPDGKKIAISVKSGDKDAIYIIDIDKNDKTKLPINLETISYASWSKNSNMIAFMGVNNKQSDIYVYDMKKNKLDNLTNDIFSDYNPEWSVDGKEIYFSSDRGNYLSQDSIPSDFKIANYKITGRNIYKINVETKKISKETDAKDSKVGYAQFSPDGKKMLYVSDESGISNIYVRETDSSGNYTSRPITNSINPIDQISLSKDGKKLLFIGLNQSGYDIYSMENPLEKKLDVTSLEKTEFVKNKLLASNKKKDTTSIYDSLKLTIKDSTNIIDSLKTEIQKTDSTKKAPDSFYGKDITIKFNNKKTDSTKVRYNSDSSYANNFNFNVSNYQKSDGSFNINKYKIKFSPDLVYGNVNYSSFYGVQGVASIALSDVMGDHRIYILTSMVIDLKNSDYAFAYYYLPKKIDYGFVLYHTARFLYYNSGFGDELYRFRNWGGNVNASLPFSKFKRLDAALSVMNLSRENLDYPDEPIEKKTVLMPSLSLVHDNTVPGYLAPMKGTRYNLTVMASPKLGEGLDFSAATGDFRTYLKLADNFSLALRLSGGTSFGADPIRFYLGGTENWINWHYEQNTITIGKSVKEFAFSTPGLPLRGYNYDRISGSNYTLANFEFRFPLFRYLILGALPLGFQDIMGNLFCDLGTAWSDKQSKLINRDANGTLKFNDLLMGTGIGTRIVAFGLPFKFDVAWNYDMQKFSSPKYYISLGLDY